MIKEKLKLNIENNIIEIQYKSLDKKLSLIFIKTIISEIKKKLDNKKGNIFIGNFETCISWRIKNN